MKHDHDGLFDGFAGPAPPADLRERTLRPAAKALIRPTDRDVWGRLWKSRAVRVVWTGGVVMLLVCHAAISTTGQTADEGSAISSMIAENNGDNELSEIVDLPKIKTLRPGLIGLREAGGSNGERRSKGEIS